MVRLLFALALIIGCWTQALAASHGNPWANAGSPLGSNLAQVTRSAPERPFLNVMKEAGGWQTAKFGNIETGDEDTLYLHCTNSDHYLSVDPATCASGFGTTFTYIVAFTNRQGGFVPPYQAGNYVLLWDGNSGPAPTTMFQFDLTSLSDAPTGVTSCPVSGHPNRILATFASPSSGQEIDQTSIGTGGSPPTNIRLVYSPNSTCSVIGTREALLNGGEIFDPVFISAMKYFNPIRHMEWMNIILNPISNWSDRALPTWVFWDEGQATRTATTSNVFDNGVPYETQIALCNELNADCWINIPFLATPSFMSSLATLAHANLKPNLKVYVEPGNEWWNITTATIITGILAAGGVLGNAAYPCTGNANPGDACPSPNPGDAFQQWFNGLPALQFVRASQAFQAVWGSDYSRVIPMIGGQFGFTARTQALLDALDTDYGGLVCSGCSGNAWSGKAAAQVKMATTAPYFPVGAQCPHAWTGDADGGIGRCVFQTTNGGLLETGVGANTTTHTTNSLNACSVATGLSANHYVVSSGHSYGSLVNGTPVQLKFDVNLSGPCDDLCVDGLACVLLQNDQDAIIIDNTAGGVPATISGTVLTITSTLQNITTCCGPPVEIGGTVNGSGTTAGTFIINYLTGQIQDTITASIASTKVMTVTATGGSNVQIGFLVVGGSVAASTLVTGNSSSGATACNGSPCTGSGGTGTYAVSISQTVGSTGGLSVESTGYAGTYKINNSQSVTCNPCTVGLPAINSVVDGTSCCDTINPWIGVYTDATSASSMTPSWRLQCPGLNCDDYPGGWIAQVVGFFMHTDIGLITGAPYNLIYGSYEGGQTFTAPSNGDESATLNVIMARSPLFAQVYAQYFGSMRAAGLNGPFMHFQDYGSTGFHGFTWGALEDSLQTTSPKYSAELDYIRRNACWWTNCRQNFLLRRDLDPANDNTPMWLDKAA